MTIASSTTKPTHSVSASSETLLIEKPKQRHRAIGGDNRERHGQRRNEGGAHIAQEAIDDEDDERDGDDAG
jgi:hypothetical protein